MNRSIPHPNHSNVTINYKCFALHPSLEKNFLEIHAKTNRPPTDTSPQITFYERIKSQTANAADQFGKSKLKEFKELDSLFKYFPVRDLIPNYFDKPSPKIKKEEDGRGINPNRPLTYDLLPIAEVDDELKEDLLINANVGRVDRSSNKTTQGKTTRKIIPEKVGCKSASPVPNDFNSYFCSSREMSYFHARNAGKGREPVEEWHLQGNPFKGHHQHKVKNGTGKSKESSNTVSSPDLNPPHFKPRTGPTRFDTITATYHYSWKEFGGKILNQSERRRRIRQHYAVRNDGEGMREGGGGKREKIVLCIGNRLKSRYSNNESESEEREEQKRGVKRVRGRELERLKRGGLFHSWIETTLSILSISFERSQFKSWGKKWRGREKGRVY